ncbi:MAG: pectinesterase family protein [Bacteroidota bacterium]
MPYKKICFFLMLFVWCHGKQLTAQTANAHQYKYIFTVAKDGSGDYKYIQEAIDAMRVFPLAPITLYIKNGVYTEKIEVPATNTDVTFIGESVEKTIIAFNDYSGRGKLNTFNSFTAKISGNRFIAENITFANTAGPVGQAVALYVDADKAMFKNCRFLGNQDTIYAGGESSRQYFTNCYIEGTTDFIFGPSTALFNNCIINAKSNSYITAASTPKDKKFGFVFLGCTITTDPVVTKLFLGRPWRGNAKTAFLNCVFPSQISAEGWDNWGNPENEKTTTYAEYNNSGAGAGTGKRLGWVKILSKKESEEYTIEKIFDNANSTVVSTEKWFQQTTPKAFTWPASTGD